MNQASLTSIIVPCYNYGHLLHEALNSLLHQTYTNWECIIVDDGSTDNTAQVASDYLKSDSRFKYIYQKNKGLAAARNTGLRAAAGKYIQLLDADDILSSEKIERHVAILETHTDTDLVYGKVFLFQKDLSEIARATPFVMQTQKSGKGEFILSSLLEDNMFLVHCALFRSLLLEDVGYFNEDMITCEDWNFWFRCAYFEKCFLFLDDDHSCVYVRSHGVNMSGNRKNMWIGKVFFRKEVSKMLSAITSRNSTFEVMIKRNDYLLMQLSTRLNLAYDNIWKGISGTIQMIVKYGDFSAVVRDSLYWVKERFLNRV